MMRKSKRLKAEKKKDNWDIAKRDHEGLKIQLGAIETERKERHSYPESPVRGN